MPELTAHPPIASHEFLSEEKALTKAYDRLNAKRRRLPMVSVEKQYKFSAAPRARRHSSSCLAGNVRWLGERLKK